MTKIIPSYKKGPKNDANNYTSIMNISTSSKNKKKLVLAYIEKHEKKAKVSLSGNHQHGFCKNRSTTTACLEIQAKLSEYLEAGKYVMLYSTDLTGAFDMLNPILFKDRLKKLEIPTKLCKILNDFLSNRAAYISINGATTEIFDIGLGCVQGSVLGPFLFNLFMRPLGEINDVTSYADDTYGIIVIDKPGPTITYLF